MKKIALGQTSQFAKDVDRSGKITLINGKMNITLSKEFNTARDQLAQFIAGDGKATYGKLSDEDKNKVHLMMAMISQETEKAGENGVQHALHPRKSEDGYVLSGDKNNRGTRTFTFEKRRTAPFPSNTTWRSRSWTSGPTTCWTRFPSARAAPSNAS